MSALEEKHRTMCKRLEVLGLTITEHANYLKHRPDSTGDSLGIGKCCYEITQILVTLKKIKKGVV